MVYFPSLGFFIFSFLLLNDFVLLQKYLAYSKSRNRYHGMIYPYK